MEPCSTQQYDMCALFDKYVKQRDVYILSCVGYIVGFIHIRQPSFILSEIHPYYKIRRLKERYRKTFYNYTFMRYITCDSEGKRYTICRPGKLLLKKQRHVVLGQRPHFILKLMFLSRNWCRF